MDRTFVAELFTCILSALCLQCHGHGFLKEPPNRSSMWRYGFDTPINYDDNKLYCGGFDVQWNRNGGKCGLCGDRWDGPRDNEAGGIYATGTISRHYQEGQIIHAQATLTMQHWGYFEFRICPNNDPSRKATQECLDKYLLRQPDGSTKYYPKRGSQTYTVSLVLPQGLTCTQCVFQWIYNTASNWGCEGGQCGRGFGHQEQFRGCADVSIAPRGSTLPNLLIPNNNNNNNTNNHLGTFGANHQDGQNVQPGNINQNNLSQTVSNPVSGNGNPVVQTCRATDQYRAQFPFADQFCISQCKAGRCLSDFFCSSGCKLLEHVTTNQNTLCDATPEFKARYADATRYCNTVCKINQCPTQYCTASCNSG